MLNSYNSVVVKLQNYTFLKCVKMLKLINKRRINGRDFGVSTDTKKGVV